DLEPAGERPGAVATGVVELPVGRVHAFGWYRHGVADVHERQMHPSDPTQRRRCRRCTPPGHGGRPPMRGPSVLSRAMITRSAPFRGVGVALVTLFDDEGEIDAPATADHAARLVDAGVGAVLVAGSTGEAAALDP